MIMRDDDIPTEATSGVMKAARPALRSVTTHEEVLRRIEAVRQHAERATPDARPLPPVYSLDHLEGTWLTELVWKPVDTKDAWGHKVRMYLPKPCVANAITILRRDPRWAGVLAWDDFTEDITTLRDPPWHRDDVAGRSERGWIESNSTRLRAWLERAYGISMGPWDADGAVVAASEAARTHPLRDYLLGLRWDGKQRLPSWLADFCGATANEYTAGVGVRWMISAVARAFEPGCQVDCTLILEGLQGMRKTSALRALVPVPGWYADTGINLGDKDSYQNLRGVWIYGLDELDSLKKGEVTRTKNFLSQTKDHYRPSYARRARDFLRSCVFAGTTNEEEYLVDRTGNRRFWPVRVLREIDVEALLKARDQLWAEARARFESGEQWYADTPEFRRLCEAEQALRVQSDPWEDIIGEWLREPRMQPDANGQRQLFPIPRDGVLTHEVLQHCLGKRPGDISRGDEMRVAGILRTLGWGKVTRVSDGEGARARRYSQKVGSWS